LIGDSIDDEDDSANAGNLYRFVGNNPVNAFDASGLWPSSSPFLGILIGGTPLTHQNAAARALPVRGTDLLAVQFADKSVDDAPFQKPALSYMHAMRDGTASQTDTVARQKANQWVKDNLSKAEDELCKCNEQSYFDALRYFGWALHTVQDSTSPAHNGRHKGGPIEFKPWYGDDWYIPIDHARALAHAIKENFDPGYGSRLDRATGDLWNKYFKCKASADPFPPDFFTYGVDKRHGGGFDN
jgi:hypothetical protein